jgi:hypothetical protein
MTETIQNDIINVGAGGGGCGESVGARSSTPDARCLPPASPPMLGRRAEGVRSGKW